MQSERKYKKEINTAGELQLFPGDAIFVREKGTIDEKNYYNVQT